MTATTRRPRTLVAALAITLAFVAAGCGSSGGSDASDTTAAKGGDATTTAASGSSDAPVMLEGTVNDEGSKDISADGAKATLDMELDDNYFSPTFVKAAPGATVTVELENEGDNPHTFTLDDGSHDKKLDPGEKATVEVTIPDDGSLRFSCDYHGGMGMQGAFYTGDGGSSASSGSTATTTTAATTGGSGY